MVVRAVGEDEVQPFFLKHISESHYLLHITNNNLDSESEIIMLVNLEV